jgi:hypothetical protein
MPADSRLPSEPGDSISYDRASRTLKILTGASAGRVTFSFDGSGSMLTLEAADGRVAARGRSHPAKEAPSTFSFHHNKQKGVFVVTGADGKVQHFRDNPTRYLLVEPDPETGEVKPLTDNGKPVCVYLCREEREV